MNKFKQSLGFIIIMIASFGIISNILHFFDIRMTESINLKSNNEYIQIKNILNEVKNNKEKIKDNDIKDQDMTIIKESINACYNGLNNLEIFNYENKKEINDIDKYILIDSFTTTRCSSALLNTLTTLAKYDNNLNSIKIILATSLYGASISLEPINERLMHNYSYSFVDLKSISKPSTYEFDMILDSIRAQALSLQFVTNYILNRVGA
jgi:hypothetical protein